ncbi:MarR family winged helix-turn-helix transcriptional regulator [Sphingomonas crocodyli]|uniref:MarR family transcriptional regulator n=1 Tax=Sphingomonas crocodyli TaxID=1979270 RepID=A0A437M906_9SPHN|nr:MarR family winged helix-turn-helix transcriptional regulator [Sphingomonas crocodyli]RVT94201.1 MarR family transcriptional regulator [Sphingomonas crocodyli]
MDHLVTSDLMLRIFQRLVWLDDGLQARLHDRGWPDVSRAQSMVMINVTAGIVRPAEIARKVGVSRQAVHTTINQMIALGMVQLAPDPDDGRHKVVELTEMGEQMRHDAQAAMGEMTRALTDRIGGDRLAALLDAMRADWGPSY